MRFGFAATAALVALPAVVWGAPPDRILIPVDANRVITLRQPVRPGAVPRNDRGPVPSTLKIEDVTLVLAPSAAQQSALNQLLETQRDPSSPHYQRWLSPEEFADRFGASVHDINAVAEWVRSQNLTVTEIARGRNFVMIAGTADQLSRAFRTAIHYYAAGNRIHYAPQAAPSIPEAFAGVVTDIRGLDDYRPEPQHLKFSRLPPQSVLGSSNYLSPDDWANIYHLTSLYAAGYTGSGQTIAVVGQTDINLSDIQAFRARFNLPAISPQVVLAGSDPGVRSGDMIEAELDLEWAGAVARNANILYVNSRNVFTSAQYVINQKLAPVISMSYGGCEAGNSSSLRSLAQQANAEGITWLASSGDSGAAACDSSSASSATQGLAVNIPASFPEVTGIGGTTFSEGSGTYWNSANNANGASAISYIPETAWNDTADRNELSATGGGRSSYYAKPSWQAGFGVPNDGMRDVPDISFSASPDHDGYLIVTNGALGVVGGTSAPTPAFAGAVGLLNQYLLSMGKLQTAGLGNLNPTLYHMAQTSASVFHDVTSGSNIVPCSAGSKDCSGGSLGYNAGPGYDQVTGLGSADISQLFAYWTGIVASVGTTVTVTANPASIAPGGTTQITATVLPLSGATAPSGSVTFSTGTANLGTASLVVSGSTASATLTVAGSSLAAGQNIVLATYAGNTTFGASSGTVTVTVASAVTASAVFVKADTTTQGNWKAAFGAEGYAVVGDLSANPSYANVSAAGNGVYTWAGSTSDVRALQKPSNVGDRIAATWYSGTSFIIDTGISDQAQHQIALYCVDWDSTSRRQTIDVLDSNGKVLNTQTLSGNFSGGVYLVWNVAGHVKLRLTSNAGANAVMSGLFFGGGSSGASAVFVKADTATQGNWKTIYGADGYAVVGDLFANPSYANVSAAGNTAYTWAGSTSDIRALQKASNAAGRIAAGWYSGTSFIVDTGISDQAQHQIALYCVDWDTTSRRQTVDVLDSNGNVLNTQTLSGNFSGGVYLVWNVAGRVKLRLTWNAGANAVMSGLFFR